MKKASELAKMLGGPQSGVTNSLDGREKFVVGMPAMSKKDYVAIHHAPRTIRKLRDEVAELKDEIKELKALLKQ